MSQEIAFFDSDKQKVCVLCNLVLIVQILALENEINEKKEEMTKLSTNVSN